MSKTEIFLSEFVGIPGTKVDILTPSIFLIKDESCNNKNNPLKEIKVTISDLDITFEAFRKNAFGSSLFTFSTFNRFEEYEQYRLIKYFVEDLLKYINAESKNDANYSPSVAWLNVAIRLGIITVFDKSIKTTYSFKQDKEIINFYNELPSDELFAKIENVEKITSDNIALNTSLLSMTRIAEDLADYKNVLLKLAEIGPIVIENEKSLLVPEIMLINELNSNYDIVPIPLPMKEGVTATTTLTTKTSDFNKDFNKLIEAVTKSTPDTEVIIESSNPEPVVEVSLESDAKKFVDMTNSVGKEYSPKKD